MSIKQYNIKRFVAAFLVFCTIILPFGSIFAVDISAAQSVIELSNTNLNGAIVLNDNNKYINTNSFITALDDGFNVSNSTPGYALSKNGVGTPFASFYIDTLGEGGSVLKGASKYNGYDAYGFISGTGEPVYRHDDETNEDVLVGHNSVAIKLQYNYSSNENLTGTDGKVWSICDDSWKSTVNGMDSVGVIGKGAVIVQKFVPSEEKSVPQSKYDWTRLNEFSKEETDGLHTVNFFQEYNPATHQTPFVVYTPAGDDLQKGVYIKFTVAYEIVNTEKYNKFLWIDGERKTYKNVVEETVFYLCNSSAEVVFENLCYEVNGSEDNTENTTDNAQSTENTTSAEQKHGAISENQGAIDGFRVDINGWNYDVTYRFNDSTNALPCADGQVFLDVGKYQFIIKTKIGVVRTKNVYIHEKTNAKNVEVYFGNGLVSGVRVFDPSETYPVYVKNTVSLKTKDENATLVKHAPLVGRVYRLDNDWNSVERDEKTGLPLGNLVSQKGADDRDWVLENLDVGMYEAVFANNAEFFDGTATGDTYKFVYRFSIVEEGQAPVVNVELLYQQIGFSDYESRHYVTRLNTKGDGDVLVVFFDETSAYDFACKYLVSTVSVENTGYTFDGIFYNTEAEMLVELRKTAKSMVEKRYYDATDINTYLTLSESIIKPILSENPTDEEKAEYDSFVSILNREFDYDILVFLTEESREDSTIGEPFLNDRIYSYIDENGMIKVKTNPVCFISVADYESSSVKLYHEGSNISYDIPHGVSAQAFLENQKAPSGRYKIVESNLTGSTEYYATYIRSGDIGTTITIERVYNNNSITQTLSKINAGIRIRANNFKILEAVNDLDPYGIVKIKKIGGDTLVYQLDECSDIPIIDEEGNFEIILVDRLGNSFSFFIDIYTAKKMHQLKLVDGDKILFSETAYGGKNFELPTLVSQNEKLEFYAWQDEAGNIYRDVYTFNSPQSVTLTAIWHYKSVNINVYDGNKVESYACKVGDLCALPSISKDGYTLYGYRYTLEDGTVRFYRSQINSVPNVENIRLDAVWRKIETLNEKLESGNNDTVKVSLVNGNLLNTLTMSKSDILELPTIENEKGMSFVGWLYEYQLSGMIFNSALNYSDLSAVGMVDENSIKLVAVWISLSTDNGDFLHSGTISNIDGGTLSDANESSQVILKNIVVSTSIALAAMIIILAVALKNKFAEAVITIVNKRNATNRDCSKRCKTVNVGRFYKKVLVPCICVLLSVLMVYSASDQMIGYAVDDISESIEEYKEEKKREEENKLRTEEINSVLSSVQSSFNQNDDSLTESEDFLYSNIIIDLLSMGYKDVFTAYAIVGGNTPETDDDRIVDGIGYTAYADAYEVNGEYIFGGGFVSLASKDSLTKEDVENGVIIQVDENEADYYECTSFKLTNNQVWGPLHYVAYGQYVNYQVTDCVVQYSIVTDNGSYIDAFGDVYSYDIGEYCHYTTYGEDFDFDAYGITSDMDYDEILSIFRETMEMQMQNGVEINVEKADFISIQAINDYIAHNQDESFLGVDAETLLYYDANITDTQYYIIYEDGSVGVLELPPDPQEKASVWERIAWAVASAGVAVLGVVCCAIPGVGPILGGAMISAAIDIFVQTTIGGATAKDINWISVGTSAIIGALTGGIGSAGNAVATSAVKKMSSEVGKFFVKLGVEVVAGMFSGATTYLVGAGIRGEDLSFEECLKSMALGAVTGAVIFAGGQALSAVAGKVGGQNLSKLGEAALTVLGGSLSGLATYMIAIALTGEEFSVAGLIIAMGMGAATATLVVIGNKIVKTVKTAQQKRQEKSTKTTTYDNYEKIEGGVKKYYDDDGNLYRVGNELAPDSDYTMNGYKYKTDSQGRVVSVEGDLYLKDSGRKPIKDSMTKIGKGSQQSTDHRGHLIGDRFNGGNGLENIVAQDGRLNQGEYKALENHWADALNAGKSVSVEIKVVYTGDSQRPTAFVVEYNVDGVSNKTFFENIRK